MLREFSKVRQEQQGFRRLFCDSDFDLYLWYEAKGAALRGFQLVYFEGDAQKALTWTESEGYRHNEVDGWDSGRFNKTPLLVPDGAFSPQALLARLEPLMGEVDAGVRELVLAKIRAYRPSGS